MKIGHFYAAAAAATTTRRMATDWLPRVHHRRDDQAALRQNNLRIVVQTPYTLGLQPPDTHARTQKHGDPFVVVIVRVRVQGERCVHARGSLETTQSKRRQTYRYYYRYALYT